MYNRLLKIYSIPWLNVFFPFVFRFFFFIRIGLARALASMKHDHDELNKSSVSPSINPSLPKDTAGLYAGLFQGGHGSPISMFSPQMLAANHTAAALMAARLASAAPNFYPHHLLGNWQMPPNNTSPPISPISPALSVKSVKKINNNNNIVSTTTKELMPNNNNTITNNNFKGGKIIEPITVKKTATKRKTTRVKKELMSSPTYHPFGMDIPQIVHDISPGPISPPTSGSSPQSIGSIEHQSPSSSSVPTTSTKDPTRDKHFTCKTCSRSFGYKHVLQNHERTHTGEKPFECPECSKRFTRDHHLKTHMRLHTGEKPYHCNHCDRKFVQVANLRRHLRVHTGEKPYTCDLCQTKFSDSNQLKAHMLIHNNAKPFQCHSCNARFRRNHHLRNHKCNINSPPTPAMSPAMSIDNKSASSRSDASEHSLDLSITVMKQMHLKQELQARRQQPPTFVTMETNENDSHQLPLDLSMEDGSECNEKRNRKSHDVRRILRMPTQILHVPTDLPEQTEPEDLSMHSPRSASPISNVDDLDDLDDAESLNRKQGRTRTRTFCDPKTFENVEFMKHHMDTKHTLLSLRSMQPPSPVEQ